MKKYEFTGKTRIINGVELKQIQRLSDGLIGGWIESEKNLSHVGNCWVYDNAIVCDDAMVFDNAIVSGNAKICNNARIYEDAMIFNNVTICQNARIYGNAMVYHNARVYDNARIFGGSRVYGDARIYDNAKIYEDAMVYGNAKVCGDAKIYGEVQKEFESIEYYQSSNTRLVIAITDKEGTLFNVGCQKLITKEEFLYRIENRNGGIEKNPHREFYKKILSLY